MLKLFDNGWTRSTAEGQQSTTLKIVPLLFFVTVVHSQQPMHHSHERTSRVHYFTKVEPVNTGKPAMKTKNNYDRASARDSRSHLRGPKKKLAHGRPLKASWPVINTNIAFDSVKITGSNTKHNHKTKHLQTPPGFSQVYVC